MPAHSVAVLIENDSAALSCVLSGLQQNYLPARVFHSTEEFIGADLSYGCLVLGLDLHGPGGQRIASLCA